MNSIRQALDEASATLAAAGIDSARVDAEYLAAHVAGVERARLPFVDPDPTFFSRFRDLIGRRAQRIPLQHIIGTAAFGPVEVQVGPGVFIPRPETEALLEWAMKLPLPASPVIVDLCTGTGALALALAHIVPRARVVAVEKSPEALVYARRNCDGTGIELLQADVTAAGLLADRDGTVDLLVSNPPYIPDGAELDPEVADHDPASALFGGPDGMAVIVPIIALAARLLRPGGQLGIEHDDTTADQVVAALVRDGSFGDIAARQDLTGRPRFVTATRQ
ncbi:peptide chain release factor N(5)-glutamine methyltransferase [Mycobacterium sp. CBMA293]|uniref:peptide chain release factor N(5)-glutamine methyltransferase n=1 Tax=unclassified Mycolicibacterium TaxID=2636767 RepID=UPI0013272487|nr:MULTISPECIES: peptide chain release factor N(5)-glutamine methyltransferase [unclassified Mycolicibacterium]MUL49704.1 peptide chain release factor N(5)-glutamine methyltransferase [Mycolicibacterium sp. CBMA 360]MUL95034.1 peptide chain release factor N(5)-glutamine methyltransferase [Mycolicibacterium sp. CBMA 230]MUM30793.1 peptide chain release factor N(5)-glutamine methyltransferase [Mycolicibacterium sp. CBMA 361]MUL62616.1 peptide chain release factor N(5)-glutamine methyltransferase 